MTKLSEGGTSGTVYFYHHEGMVHLFHPAQVMAMFADDQLWVAGVSAPAFTLASLFEDEKAVPERL